MYKLLFHIKLAAIILLLSRQADDFKGVWENEDKTVRIEIFLENEAYHGRLLYADGNIFPKTRHVNANHVLTQMKRKGNVLYGGTYRDHSTQNENEARIRLINDTTFTMKVFNGWFGKHYKWHKVKK